MTHRRGMRAERDLERQFLRLVIDQKQGGCLRGNDMHRRLHDHFEQARMAQRRRDCAGRGGMDERVPQLLHEPIVDESCAKRFDLRRLLIDYLLHPARGAVRIAARFIHRVLGEIVRFRETIRGATFSHIGANLKGLSVRGGRESDPQARPRPMPALSGATESDRKAEH